MRKIDLIWLSVFMFMLLWFPILCSAQKMGSQAKISVSEAEWDFGYVPNEGSVSHIFQIDNLGKDSLFIYQVRPTCGCTTAPLDRDRLGVGESANLKVNFSSRRFWGKINKSVKIVCNDENLPFLNVVFSATVDSQNPVVKIMPAVVTFDSVEKGEQNQRIVNVQNIDTSTLEISPVEWGEEFLNCKIEKRLLGPNESTQIVFEIKKDAPLGWFQTSLTLDFQGSEKVRCSVPIRGTIIAKD